MKEDLIKNFSVNVVMYHYVREIKKSKYPDLKGLEFNEFKRQVNYFCKNFNVLTNADLIEIIATKRIPKKPSIFLTFDDGYIDHYKFVFPFLVKKKISGIFYPPINAVENKIVLDVNKIHFILEKEKNRKKILDEIDKYLVKKKLKPISEFDLSKINLNIRYDDKDTALIKSLLQYCFPKNLRIKICNFLFKKILDKDLKEFSRELYMNKKQILEMDTENMNFGSHGVNHYWWEYLNKNEQENEIKGSINYFKRINVDTSNFSVCYPHGSYSLNTIALLKKYKVKFAFTSQVGGINLKNLNKNFLFPRYDTNDFKIIT